MNNTRCLKLFCSGLSGAVVLLTTIAGQAANRERDERPAPLDQIVVVASKYQSRVRDIAADVSTLTDEQLNETFSASLADVFRYTPGIAHETSGSRFGAEGIVIRGVGGNRVAMEIDGVPLSDQFDIGNFSNAGRDFLDPGFVGRVEVLRGPASALYGSSALGGVVAVETPDPARLASAGEFGGNLAGFHRSADSSDNLHGRFAWQGNSAGVLFAASHRDGHEREAKGAPRDAQEFERNSALLKAQGVNRFGHQWRVSTLHQKSDAQTDVTSVLGSGRFRSTTALSGDDDQTLSFVSALYGTSSTADSDQSLQLRLYTGETDIVQRSIDERASAASPVRIAREFNYLQRQVGAELNAHRDFITGQWSHRLAAGVEWSRKETTELRGASSTSLIDGSSTNTVLGETFPLRDFPLSTTRELGAYVSDRISNERLTLLLGVRFDENRLRPEDDAIFREDNPAVETVALTESDLSPKIGVIVRLGSNADLYAQYARGFRAPPFEDANIGLDIPLFNIRAIPNRELRSETSDGYEIGIRWQSLTSDASLTLFRTEYKDFIATKVRLGLDPVSGRLLFQSQNIRSATIEGAEIRARHSLDDWFAGLDLSISAYWARGENKVTGEALDSVGPAQGVIGLNWHSPSDRTGVQALIRATAAWTQRDETAGELFKPPAHTSLDLYVNHQVTDSINLRVGVNNVLDEKFWQWSEVRGLGNTDVLLPGLAASGRHFSAGIEWNW